MKKRLFYLLLVIGLCFFGCGSSEQGGSEAGNPRTLIGSLATAGTQNLALHDDEEEGDDDDDDDDEDDEEEGDSDEEGNGGCPADTAIATDATAETTLATVDETDCSFSLNLAINKAYTVGFVLSNQFVASLILNNSPTLLNSRIIYIASGEGAINLGLVTISDDGKAQPENEPSEQTDYDSDGIFDFFDDDFDGDGTDDDLEEDCDFDGFFDDFDSDTEECEDDGDDDDNDDDGGAEVLEVYPYDGDGIDFPEDAIELDEDVEVRFSCELDVDALSTEMFMVSSDEHTVSCTLELFSGNRGLICEHEDDLFLASTIYTATVDAIPCLDGEMVETVSWSWQTVEED